MKNEDFQEQSTSLLHLKWDNESMIRNICPIFQKECLGEKCHSYYSGQVIKKHTDTGGFLDESITGVYYRKYIPQCQNAIVTGTIEYQEP